MKNLSINLRNLLLNTKLSENELARRTGISQQIINRILSGENKNPKIATLSPLANYFMVSISQLIGDDLSTLTTSTHSQHPGFQAVPLIDWSQLSSHSLEEALLLHNQTLLVEMKPTNSIFAITIQDDSMEPKFSKGSLLILDSDKKPISGDFVLMKRPKNNLIFRQFFSKNNHAYQKCLNPTHENDTLSLINEDAIYIGTLVQSRTNYLS